MPGCPHVLEAAPMGPALLAVAKVSSQGCELRLKTARWSSLGPCGSRLPTEDGRSGPGVLLAKTSSAWASACAGHEQPRGKSFPDSCLEQSWSTPETSPPRGNFSSLPLGAVALPSCRHKEILNLV